MPNHNLFARSVRARPPHPLSSIVCDASVAEGTNRLFRHPMPSARKCASALLAATASAHTRDASAPHPAYATPEETQSCCKEPSVNEGPAPRVALKTMAPSDAARERSAPRRDARGLASNASASSSLDG